ncbi:hypothetical protein T12_13162 [Trichinella patagoniensis]|uniref:Uncharacterized protein n=1 Tax=Trichinella patagoniensis TaxID=990121 RepID=A0A0V1ABP7_9BILA|nr:hypothetical protein T12_13162 [Trichinella patagoniensis]
MMLGLNEYNKRITADPSCIVLDISQHKWLAYLCIETGKVPTVEAHYSTTTGQISPKLCSYFYLSNEKCTVAIFISRNEENENLHASLRPSVDGSSAF